MNLYSRNLAKCLGLVLWMLGQDFEVKTSQLCRRRDRAYINLIITPQLDFPRVSIPFSFQANLSGYRLEHAENRNSDFSHILYQFHK